MTRSEPPDRTTRLLREVEDLLRAGRAHDALRLLPAGGSELLIENARGVCLLRSGQAKEAVALFRRLALVGQTTTLDLGQPATVHVNFATALLLDGNVAGCLEVLWELRDDADPAVQRLRGFVERWRRGLGWWQRLMFKIYGDPPAPPQLDFEPGELLFATSGRPKRAA